MDRDNDGDIDLDELQNLMSKFGHKLSEQEAAAAVMLIQQNNDHVIGVDAFCAWFSGLKNIVGILSQLQTIWAETHSPTDGGLVDIVKTHDSLKRHMTRQTVVKTEAAAEVGDGDADAAVAAENSDSKLR
jgi:hypothetical protein